MNFETVFFEPWSLGDALIAAAVCQHVKNNAALACQPGWHAILKEVLNNSKVKLIPVELTYTRRNEISTQKSLEPLANAKKVLNIRGDIRDFLSARKLFPKAKIQMSGWVPFLARRISWMDFPFRYQTLPVKNRYQAWAKIANIDFQKVELSYQQKQKEKKDSNKVAIHIGAQWTSKQYPYVFELKKALMQRNFQVEILASPQDRLPSNIQKTEVICSQNIDLVHRLHSARFVITNDSGPMHLAALLGCRTVVVAHIANIMEWLPPATCAVISSQMPKGYMPKHEYCSDQQISGWPSVNEVMDKLVLANDA